MAHCLVQQYPWARFLAIFHSYRRIRITVRIRQKLLSMMQDFPLFWNDLINDVPHLLRWFLCVAHLNGLRTKNVVLSTQEAIPITLYTTTEEMTEQDVAYIRVSTREQAENTHALEQQRARVIDAGAKQIFEDVLKGKNDKRPGFQRLLELVKRGKIRTIYITRFDRFTRSLRTLKMLVELLNEYGVRLVSLDQKMDLSTAQGKMVLNMLGMLAEWEVDLLSERIQHGKKHQRNQQWANSLAPWGYEVVDHKYVLDQTPFLCLLSDCPSDPTVLIPVRTIADLARDSIQIFFDKKGARRALKVIFEKYGIVKTSAKFTSTDKIFHWSIRGFTLWLKNPVLAGHTAYLQYKTVGDKRVPVPMEEWEIIKDTHPNDLLFRDGEAENVKTILKTNTRNASGCFQKSLTGSDNYRPFAYQTGLIYCEACGSKCTPKGNSDNSDYLYYACRHAGIGCDNHKSVRRKNIEESLIDALVEQSRNLNQEETPSDDTPNTSPIHSAALARLEAQLAILDQAPGFHPDIEDLKQKLRQQIEEEKNPFLFEDKVFDSSVEDLIRAGNNLAIWHLLNNDEKVEIYGKLVNKISIRDGKVVSVVFNP